jgi:ribosomal protein L12E/L44/L45/RPP1/RPP2
MLNKINYQINENKIKRILPYQNIETEQSNINRLIVLVILLMGI